MKRIARILGIGLVLCLMTAGVVAAGPSALETTVWVGQLCFATPGEDDNVTITIDNATLTFTGEKGAFLVGTLTLTDATTGETKDNVSFSCIRSGTSLQMAAANWLFSAEITHGRWPKKGTAPRPRMAVLGSNFGEESSMFKGTLIRQ